MKNPFTINDLKIWGIAVGIAGALIGLAVGVLSGDESGMEILTAFFGAVVGYGAGILLGAFLLTLRFIFRPVGIFLLKKIQAIIKRIQNEIQVSRNLRSLKAEMHDVDELLKRREELISYNLPSQKELHSISRLLFFIEGLGENQIDEKEHLRLELDRIDDRKKALNDKLTQISSTGSVIKSIEEYNKRKVKRLVCSGLILSFIIAGVLLSNYRIRMINKMIKETEMIQEERSTVGALYDNNIPQYIGERYLWIESVKCMTIYTEAKGYEEGKEVTYEKWDDQVNVTIIADKSFDAADDDYKYDCLKDLHSLIDEEAEVLMATSPRYYEYFHNPVMIKSVYTDIYPKRYVNVYVVSGGKRYDYNRMNK